MTDHAIIEMNKETDKAFGLQLILEHQFEIRGLSIQVCGECNESQVYYKHDYICIRCRKEKDESLLE